MSIISNGTELGPSPVVAGTPLKSDLLAQWHVEQTGSANPTYIIKSIINEILVVDLFDGVLTLILRSSLTQLWEIECAQYLSGASATPSRGKFTVDGLIKSVPSGFCAQDKIDFLGEITLRDCADVEQKWYFTPPTIV
ncbi:hypothetical protein C8R44DRAFT_889205 [Mycena epipterygia]|nr:hypothetical protein C8R44DRAFT_889205 [Mycena epipterygia]